MPPRMVCVLALTTLAVGVSVTSAAAKETLVGTMTVAAPAASDATSTFTLSSGVKYRIVISGQVRSSVPEGTTINPVTGKPSPAGFSDADAFYCFGRSDGAGCTPPERESDLCLGLRKSEIVPLCSAPHAFAGGSAAPYPAFSASHAYELQYKGSEGKLYARGGGCVECRSVTRAGSYTIQVFTTTADSPTCPAQPTARAAAAVPGCAYEVRFGFHLDGFPEFPREKFLPGNLVGVDLRTTSTKLRTDAEGDYQGSGTLVMTNTYLGRTTEPFDRVVAFKLEGEGNFSQNLNAVRFRARATASQDRNCPKGARILVLLTGEKGRPLLMLSPDVEDTTPPTRPSIPCLSYRGDVTPNRITEVNLMWKARRFFKQVSLKRPKLVTSGR